MQKPGIVARRSADGQHAVGAAVDLLHVLGFAVEVAAVALDDAQRVDPEVAPAQGAGDGDGVAKGGGEGGEGDAREV